MHLFRCTTELCDDARSCVRQTYNYVQQSHNVFQLHVSITNVTSSGCLEQEYSQNKDKCGKVRIKPFDVGFGRLQHS